MGFHPSSNKPESPQSPDPNAADWVQQMGSTPGSSTFSTFAPQIPPKPKQRSGCTTILILTLLAVIVVGCGAIFFAAYQDDQNQKATQTAMFTAYGSDLMALCSKPKTSARAALPKGKVLVLWDSSTNQHNGIAGALPADLRATTKDGLVAVACIKQENQLFHTIKYEKGDVSRGTCKEWRISLQVFLIEVKSGKVVDTGTFLGAEPPECPKTITVKQGQNADEHRYGAQPNDALIADWLKKRLVG